MNGIGEAMMLTWAGFGMIIEKQNETRESLEVYISVPEHSFEVDAEQTEMAGEVLAKRFKTVLTDMGVKRLIVKYRVRPGEYWTPEMRRNAELDMRRTLYGSQY